MQTLTRSDFSTDALLAGLTMCPISEESASSQISCSRSLRSIRDKRVAAQLAADAEAACAASRGRSRRARAQAYDSASASNVPVIQGFITAHDLIACT